MEGLISCPECGFENAQGTTACKRCLLVFAKFERKNTRVHQIINASPKLEGLWRDLLSDYDNISKHEKFVTQALGEKNLAFPSQQYRKMMELNPSDETSQKMIEKIIQVATLTYIPPSRPMQVEKKSKGFKKFIIYLVVSSILGLLVEVFFRHR